MLRGYSIGDLVQIIRRDFFQKSQNLTKIEKNVTRVDLSSGDKNRGEM